MMLAARSILPRAFSSATAAHRTLSLARLPAVRSGAKIAEGTPTWLRNVSFEPPPPAPELGCGLLLLLKKLVWLRRAGSGGGGGPWDGLQENRSSESLES